MTTAPKKDAVCKTCKALPTFEARKCDGEGCGRLGCRHLVTGDGKFDLCGPCKLRRHRDKKKAETPPAPPEGGAA